LKSTVATPYTGHITSLKGGMNACCVFGDSC
jgi:hypothetical protein